MYRFRNKGTQAGQGLIEYLLILILTVSIVFAVARGVGTPLIAYVRNNIFELVGCMLRIGEGPAVAFQACGGTDALQFNYEELNAIGSAGSGSSDSANSNSSSNAENGADDSSSNSNGDQQSSNVREPSRRDSIDGSNGRGGGGRANNEFGSDDSAGANKRVKIDEDPVGADGSFRSKGIGQQTVVIRRVKRKNGQVGGSFSLIDKEEAINSEEAQLQTPSNKKKKIPLEEARTKRKVSSFSYSDRKTSNAKIEDYDASGGFSFIKLIKWGVIIAILVIFIVFTASQLNSIRKGWTE